MDNFNLKKFLGEKSLLNENAPGYDTRKTGEALPTLESVKAAYEAKQDKEEVKEGVWSVLPDRIPEFIQKIEEYQKMVQVKVALLKFRFPLPQNLKKITLRFDVYLENVKLCSTLRVYLL